MTRTPLFYGLFYIAFGIMLVALVSSIISQTGEASFFIYLFVIFATFDIGKGIKLIIFHFKTFRHSNHTK